MSYTPVNTDATNVAAYVITRLNTASPSSSAVTNDQNTAVADAYLGTFGYQGLQSDAFALGTATTATTSFSDVGNGTTTGYSPWTFSVPIAKTYLINVNCSAYMASTTGGGTAIFFQLLVDGVAQPTTSEMQQFFNGVDSKHFIFSVPVALSAGSHTVKLQWKSAATTTTARVDAGSEGRCFRITG